MNAKLTFRSGTSSGNEKEIITDLLRIGRDPANDFVIDEIEVSRNHAKITHKMKDYVIEDLNSTNGTFLNGKKLNKPEKLKDGDLIGLGGNIILEFSLRNESEKEGQELRIEKPVEKTEGKRLFSKKKEEPSSNDLEEEKTNETGKKNFSQTLSKLPTWAIVLLIALGFIVLFCIIPAILIEVTNQWCNLFSGFFNAMSPGICP
jgi:pSer/pThr/pTyr-binding forkhead associated (FHA) protein